MIYVVKSHLLFHLFFHFKLTLHTCTCEYLHLHLVQLQEKEEGGREGVLTRGDVSCESPPAAPISLHTEQLLCHCSLPALRSEYFIYVQYSVGYGTGGMLC